MDMDFSSLFKDFDISSLDENALYPSNTKVMNPFSSDDVSNDEMKPALTMEETTSVLNNELKPDLTNYINSPSCKSIDLSENTLTLQKECSKISENNSFLKKTVNSHFSCNVCLKSFSSNSSLKRHEKLHNKEKLQLLKCDLCGFTSTRKDHLNAHLKDYKNSPFVCTRCNMKFCRYSNLKTHICNQHSHNTKMHEKNDKSGNTPKLFSSTTFKCCEENNSNISEFLISLKPKVENELQNQFNKRKPIKYFLTLEGYVINSLQNDNVETLTLFIDSNIIYIFSESDISEYIDKTFADIIQQFLHFQSEWTLKQLVQLTVCTIQYNVF